MLAKSPVTFFQRKWIDWSIIWLEGFNAGPYGGQYPSQKASSTFRNFGWFIRGCPNKQFPSRREHGEFPNYANQGLIQGWHWHGQTGVVEIPYTIHTRTVFNSGSMSVNFLMGVIHIHPQFLPVKTLKPLPQKPWHWNVGPPLSWTVSCWSTGLLLPLRRGLVDLASTQMRCRDRGVLLSGQRSGVVDSWWIIPFKNGSFDGIWGYAPAKGIRTNGSLAWWVSSFLEHMVIGCS